MFRLFCLIIIWLMYIGIRALLLKTAPLTHNCQKWIQLTALEWSSLSYSLSGHHQGALQSHVTNFAEGFKWCNHVLPCAKCPSKQSGQGPLKKRIFWHVTNFEGGFKWCNPAMPSTLPICNLDKDLRPEQKMFGTFLSCLTWLALFSWWILSHCRAIFLLSVIYPKLFDK